MEATEQGRRLTCASVDSTFRRESYKRRDEQHAHRIYHGRYKRLMNTVCHLVPKAPILLAPFADSVSGTSRTYQMHERANCVVYTQRSIDQYVRSIAAALQFILLSSVRLIPGTLWCQPATCQPYVINNDKKL